MSLGEYVSVSSQLDSLRAQLSPDPAEAAAPEIPDLADPVQAATASAFSFTVGALLPLFAILLPPPGWRVPVTFVAVLLALAMAGAVSARIGHSNLPRGVLGVVIGGALGLALTYGVGGLCGIAIRQPSPRPPITRPLCRRRRTGWRRGCSMHPRWRERPPHGPPRPASWPDVTESRRSSARGGPAKPRPWW